jgi:hypothetical protein
MESLSTRREWRECGWQGYFGRDVVCAAATLSNRELSLNMQLSTLNK